MPFSLSSSLLTHRPKGRGKGSVQCGAQHLQDQTPAVEPPFSRCREDGPCPPPSGPLRWWEGMAAGQPDSWVPWGLRAGGRLALPPALLTQFAGAPVALAWEQGGPP